jgi:putative FmdB family regulatory protein
MPTYEYACSACGHQFERFESITAAPNKSCEKCKKKKAERRISGGGGFLFKGTGFYVTDYKKTSGSGGGGGSEGKPSDAKPAAAEHSCTGACSHGAKTETKTESKPEPTPTKPSKTKVA